MIRPNTKQMISNAFVRGYLMERADYLTNNAPEVYSIIIDCLETLLDAAEYRREVGGE